MAEFRIGILDQSPVPEGSSSGDALRNSIDLARLADRLGYHRYWVAEHHGTAGLACTSPEVLIGSLAAATSRIRIGSGGVMLPHYSPLKVAENFAMLTALYPGRIDLGVGRAAGTSPRVAFALQRDRRQPAPDDFFEQLQELLGYLANRSTGDGPFPQLNSALPWTVTPPEPWLLGSSAQSAIWAAELGVPYAFADFINPDGAAMAALYRRSFHPSHWLPEPKTAVAAWAICADTDSEALRLSFSLRMMALLLMRGRTIAVPSVEKAERFLAAEGAPPESVPAGRRIITGSPDKVRVAVESLAREYQADEVLLVNILYDHAARRRSYELLATALILATPEPTEAESRRSAHTR
jgi:luciferase family oxidoreductase group 1